MKLQFVFNIAFCRLSFAYFSNKFYFLTSIPIIHTENMLHGGVLSNDYVIWSFFTCSPKTHHTQLFFKRTKERQRMTIWNELLGFTARWTLSCFTFYNNYQSLHQNLSCRSFVTFVWWGLHTGRDRAEKKVWSLLQTKSTLVTYTFCRRRDSILLNGTWRDSTKNLRNRAIVVDNKNFDRSIYRNHLRCSTLRRAKKLEMILWI